MAAVFFLVAFAGPDSLLLADAPASADSLEGAVAAVGNSKTSPPGRLFLSSLLPVIADGQALKVKVAEARRIVLQLDKETLAEKSKLPNVAGVFDPIHWGLAKPAKPGEYGGGMSPRLEFIEKNLTKSLQTLAKLPSSCAGADGQWRAAVAGQKLLIKTLTQAKQAQAQATWTAKESDKLIRAALKRLKAQDDKASVAALEAYNKELQSGLDAVAKALAKGLAGKSLNKKLMPALGAKCGSMVTAKLPSAKDAGNLLAGLGGAKSSGDMLAAAEAIPPSPKSKIVAAASPGGAGDAPDCAFGVTTMLCGLDYAGMIRLDSDEVADNKQALADMQTQCASGNSFACGFVKGYQTYLDCSVQKLALHQKLWKEAQAKCGKKCPEGQTLDKDGKSCICLDGSKPLNGQCVSKKCSSGQLVQGQCVCAGMPFEPKDACCTSNGKLVDFGIPISGGKCGCPKGLSLNTGSLGEMYCFCTVGNMVMDMVKKTCSCDKGQTLSADGKSCLCPDGSKADDNGECKKKCAIEGQTPNSAGVCACPAGQIEARVSLWGFGPKVCAPTCSGKAYDSKKDCCDTSGILHKGVVANAKGICSAKCGSAEYNTADACCSRGNLHLGEAPTWLGRACSKKAWQENQDAAAVWKWEDKTTGKTVESGVECDGNGGFQINYGLWQGVPCGMMDCVRLHEKYHIGDYNNFYSNSCKKGQHSGELPIIPAADISAFRQQTECAAHLRVAAPCLDKKASQAPSNACKGFLKQQRIDDIDETFKVYHCEKLNY